MYFSNIYLFSFFVFFLYYFYKYMNKISYMGWVGEDDDNGWPVSGWLAGMAGSPEGPGP